MKTIGTKAKPSDADRPQPASTRVRKTRIMIVDDHEVLRDGMRLMIEQQRDLEVCSEADDELQALAHYRKSRPHLVIVDISLKSGNGIDLIKRIKALDASARIIVYSMHDEQVYAERVLRAGGMGYVTKQKPAESLLQAIRCVLDDKLSFSDELTQRILERAASREPLAAQSPVATLSDRELEVFEMLGRGMTTPRHRSASAPQLANDRHLPRTAEDQARSRQRLRAALPGRPLGSRRPVGDSPTRVCDYPRRIENAASVTMPPVP